MTDLETKLPDRAVTAANNFAANTIVSPIVGYTWAQAMRDAAYSESYIDSNSMRVWGYSGTQEIIKAKRIEIAKQSIASRAERQSFWTKVANGEVDGASMGDRLRASELLGRSEADFTDKMQMDNQFTVNIQRFTPALPANEPAEAIGAAPVDKRLE